MSKDILSVENITMQFGGVVAVNNLSLHIPEGQIVALIGPNGAGKTTAFNCITGVYEPTNGRVDFMGEPIVCNHPRGKMKKSYAGAESERYLSLPTVSYTPDKITKRGIARTFQNIELFEHATVLHNLLIGRHTHRQTGLWSEMFFTPATRRAELQAREHVERVIDLLDLQHHRDSMVAGLPYGVRKVVELARALCAEPRLLLLDEPSSGLNVEETEDMAFWIQDIVHELGITVLMVEHDMTLVSRVSDRVLAMNQGEVLAMGTPREVQTHPGVIEAYLGTIDDVSNLRRPAGSSMGVRT